MIIKSIQLSNFRNYEKLDISFDSETNIIFVGMLTDSRSFLSYTRHDYFRRILCNLIGQWVEDGEYPNDEKALEKIVKGICFDNAKRYFNL